MDRSLAKITAYDAGTHTCSIIFIASTNRPLTDIRVADNIDAADVAADNMCIVAQFSPQPSDMIIIAGWTP